VSSDLVHVFLLSLVAMFNPTLLAAVTVMLPLPNPTPSHARLRTRRLHDEHHARPADRVLAARLEHREHRTSKHKISPVKDIVVGPLFVASRGFCEQGATNRLMSAVGKRRRPR
jgi:hypothetical protein